MRVAIVAALPREVAPLVKGWERREVARHVYVWTRGAIVVACAGMGRDRGTLACEAAIKAGDVNTLISAGLAGACDPALRAAAVVYAGVVIDAKTGERFGTSAQGGPVVVSSPVIAAVEEKRRLWQAYGAAAVDMEAATVARIARAHGLEFRAVKAISDEADFAMDGLERFATSDGQFREGAIALHAALRPRMWSALLALGRNGTKAVCALTEALRAEID